jgi:tetratricopeptide (TPR) repeat protein
MSNPKCRTIFAAAVALALPLGGCGTITRLSDTLNGTRVVSMPPSPTAEGYGHYLSAHLAASEHDLGAAARYYRDALEHDPNNADILTRAFLYTAASGDVRGAAKLAARVVAVKPNDRAARLALTVEDIKRGNFDSARMQIGQSGRGPFTSLTLILLDAWAAEGAGKIDAALSALKQVPQQGGTEALSHFHSALVLDLAGRNDEANKEYQAALLASGPSPRQVEAYGRFLERTGHIAEAKAFYAKLANRGSVAPVVAAGQARIAAGRRPRRMIRGAQEGAAEALFGIAASLTDASSADIAILYLRLGLYLSPHLDLAKIVLADRFETLGKYEDAIAVYDSIDSDSPYKLAATIQAAVDETRLKHTDKAIDQLKEITADAPDNVTAWTALGDAYRSVERYGEAAKAYDRAVKAVGPVTKKDWPLFYARAISEERAKDWPAAERDLRRALKLSPEQPEVLNYLGYSWVDRGVNLAEALALLEKARALSPFDGYIVDSVGWAYYRLGRYQDAAEALQQAVQLVPGDPTINEHLGDAYWKVGRKLEARFQWGHALAFGPDPGQKVKLERKLQHGLANGTKP